MFGLGPTELIIIAVLLLFIFGAKRLPEIGKNLGGALGELKNIKKEFDPKETDTKVTDNKKTIEKNDSQPSLEAEVADKILGQVPGVKKIMAVKKKAEQVKKMLE